MWFTVLLPPNHNPDCLRLLRFYLWDQFQRTSATGLLLSPPPFELKRHENLPVGKSYASFIRRCIRRSVDFDSGGRQKKHIFLSLLGCLQIVLIAPRVFCNLSVHYLCHRGAAVYHMKMFCPSSGGKMMLIYLSFVQNRHDVRSFNWSECGNKSSETFNKGKKTQKQLYCYCVNAHNLFTCQN